MARVIVTDEASFDEAGILNDLRTKAGLPTVVKFRGLFSSLYNRLAAHPGIGARRAALGSNIRIGIVSPYIIIYRHTEDDDTVTVLRIVHGRRRITSFFLKLREELGSQLPGSRFEVTLSEAG